VLPAASPALNRAGEGSNPSGPTDNKALVVQRRRLRTRNAETPVRVRAGALCSLTIEKDYEASAHDVAAAYCLAMAEARVQLPLGALASAHGKAWQFRRFREPEIVGSNPTAPTRLRWGPCWYGQAPVKRTDTGSIPVTAAGRTSQWAMAAVSKTVER
jgi:hypothetical protein